MLEEQQRDQSLWNSPGSGADSGADSGEDSGEAGRQREWGAVDYLAFIKTFKQKKRGHGRVLKRGVA